MRGIGENEMTERKMKNERFVALAKFPHSRRFDIAHCSSEFRQEASTHDRLPDTPLVLLLGLT